MVNATKAPFPAHLLSNIPWSCLTKACFLILQVPAVRSRVLATINVNIQGESGSMSKKTKVVIEPPAFIHIIQTDKPIYKPGQTGRSTGGGILDFSHPLIPEAAQGNYMVIATTDQDEQISHSFEIKEYVLPKYEVKVHLPNVITILDQEATLKICGKYTYGKPVSGSVKAVICRKAMWFFWYINDQAKDICKTYTLTTDKSGCAAQTVNLTEFSLSKSMYRENFEVNAEIEEFGTGSHVIRTVTFEDVPETYKPGIPFEGKVKVVDPQNNPVANESVYMMYNSQNLVLTTNIKGMASFYLDTSRWTDTITLQVSYQYRPAYLHVNAFYSKSSSFVKLLQVTIIELCYYEVLRVYTEPSMCHVCIHLYYNIVIKCSILDKYVICVSMYFESCHISVSFCISTQVNHGKVSIPLGQVTDLAPFAQVVVYTVMPSGEAVADGRDFPIQLCLNNKVSLKFSSLQKLPADKTSLSLQAHPGSMCSVRAIDQSVLLLKPEQELSVDYKLSGYTHDTEDYEPYPCLPEPVPMPQPVPDIVNETAPQRETRSIYFRLPNNKDDVYSIFKEVGIKIVTNSDVKKPICHLMLSIVFTTIRTYFPETWIWELVSLGDSGSVDVEKTVPDTITKWAAGAFCVSSVGFGVSPNTGLTVFQPFFVSLTLPYSVIRGEVFTLKATVFNYLSKCIMVKVMLAASEQYTFRNCDGCQYSVCLCGEESRTFSWIVTPTALGDVSLKVSAEALKTDVLCGNEVATVPDVGQIDTVIRTLLVELLSCCCSCYQNFVKHTSRKHNVSRVESWTLTVASRAGDLMGRAMKNLHKLLAMPYGCGEQNMVLFAPNIFILNYLKSTGQLTLEIQDKATRFLESGYQRELTYKHDDGSYSAFGKNDESGNTWLTSFVMKSFGGARPYIYVNPDHINSARRWLSGLQQQDGCIKSVGKLFHNGMKGGVSDDVSLTAYITAALLELDTSVTDPMVQRCLGCLKEAVVGQLDNLYTTALMSYTFTLAGDQDMRSKLLTYLHQKSTGTRHWKRDEASKKTLDSLEVEMTSYVLLALLSGPALTDFGLDYSSDIVRWLTQQQNPYGGFSSTQDTVVALQALAKYGAATYREEGSTTVTVTSLGGLSKEFTVDQSNRLLYQEEKLTEVPGEYTVKAEGQGCVLAQISMHFNIPPPPDFSAFNISTHTMSKCNVSRPQLILFVHVRYSGRREETNMAIINIKLLSGYILDKTSLNLVKGFINIYLDGLKKEKTNMYSVTLEEDLPVRNLKPAVVKVYDYYQTSDEAVTEYTSPCAESM
uniref:Uncharacterized protein n=1 Tax=Anabas testudineus TaxID=64144 RepID=A0AAQ6IIX1_ANATE